MQGSVCWHCRGSCSSLGAVWGVLAGLGSPGCHSAALCPRRPGPAGGVCQGEDHAAALPRPVCGERGGTGAGKNREYCYQVTFVALTWDNLYRTFGSQKSRGMMGFIFILLVWNCIETI